MLKKKEIRIDKFKSSNKAMFQTANIFRLEPQTLYLFQSRRGNHERGTFFDTGIGFNVIENKLITLNLCLR